MIILVASHPRSGTHFMIDSIVNNVQGAEFPKVRPSFISFENLVLPHDQAVVEEWKQHVYDHEGKVLVAKTHMLPEEVIGCIENPALLGGEQERDLIKAIWEQSRKVCICRGVEDTITSLFHYTKRGDYIFHKARVRCKRMEFSEFMRSPNYSVHPCRTFQEYDANRVSFWAEHKRQWLEHSESFVRYEDLKHDFENTMNTMAETIGISDLLVRPVRQVQIIKDPKPGRLQAIKYKLFLHRRQKSKNTAVFARKGVVGDHKTIFTESDHAFVAEHVDPEDKAK